MSLLLTRIQDGFLCPSQACLSFCRDKLAAGNHPGCLGLVPLAALTASVMWAGHSTARLQGTGTGYLTVSCSRCVGSGFSPGCAVDDRVTEAVRQNGGESELRH